MSRERILTVAGGLVAFAAFVAAGAFAIVSLAPPERPVAAAKGALLMETASLPRAFDDRPSPSASPSLPQADLGGPRDLVETKGAPPSSDRAAPSPRRAPREGGSGDGGKSSTSLLPQVATAPARGPGSLMAALPTDAKLPGPEPKTILAPRPERQPDGVLTAAEIRRFRLSLRLTREQEPYWLPVEQALTEIGTQQAAMVRAGQNPKDAFGVGAAMRIYPVARPLLGVLREDQKARVRDQARAMGFGSIASSI